MAVDYKKVMLGTFSPQKEAYVIELQEETTPSGFLARGNYTARTKVTIFEIYAHTSLQNQCLDKDWEYQWTVPG